MNLHYTKAQVEAALKRACTHADNVTLTNERNYLEDWLTLAAEVEAAFRAGYHAVWIREGGGLWSFDPMLRPGDADGAWRAYWKNPPVRTP